MVTFTKGSKGSKNVITGSTSVIERLVTDPVGKRVDAESRLVNNKVSNDTSVDKASDPVAPAQTGNESRSDKEDKTRMFM